MHLDAAELKGFYHGTRLGRFAAVRLKAKVAEMWPDTRGLTVVGFGFASPALCACSASAARVLNFMPERQGVITWPQGGANTSVLTHESDWPLPTGIADRVLMLHGLETSGNPGAVLDECWRILAPEGKVLIIVPNRAGMWARRDGTPFGFGRPYTAGQLESHLGKRRFGVLRTETALFAPPSGRRFWINSASMWERIGRHAPLSFAGGVLLQEACKRVFQMHRPPLAETVANRIKALEGMAVPGAKPVSSRN